MNGVCDQVLSDLGTVDFVRLAPVIHQIFHALTRPQRSYAGMKAGLRLIYRDDGFVRLVIGTCREMNFAYAATDLAIDEQWLSHEKVGRPLGVDV